MNLTLTRQMNKCGKLVFAHLKKLAKLDDKVCSIEDNKRLLIIESNESKRHIIITEALHNFVKAARKTNDEAYFSEVDAKYIESLLETYNENFNDFIDGVENQIARNNGWDVMKL